MSNGFTPQQLKAAQLLASGVSQSKTAKEVGVSRITVIRWLKIAEFRTKVADLGRKVEKVETQAFVQETKQRVRGGVATLNETLELLSSVVRDEDCRLSDRIKAAETLGKWLGWGEGKGYQQPPELPSKPFNQAEMSHRLEILKSRAIVASEFLIEQAIASAATGQIENATTVIAKSLDLASDCTNDVSNAANVLTRQGFVILTPTEYSRLLPEGQKSAPHLLQPLNFDRIFNWRWLKRKSS